MINDASIDTAKNLPPADEMDELLKRHNLYAEMQEPFEHRHLIIIRTADGRQIWSRRHHDLKTLSDMTLEYLREYKKE